VAGLPRPLTGWASASHETKWEAIWDLRFQELGAGSLESSSKDMQLKLKGTANNKYREVTVLMLDLR
jgi:hypothetical protein